MSVLSKIGYFLQRHRNKILIGSVIVTSTGLLLHYGQQKLKEWQEKEAREFFERTRKQQHYESTERTCNQTIMSLINALCESINKAIDTEEIVVELRNNPKNKLELWEKLKISVFVKVSCVIYVSAMLVVLLRVQLSIVSGYLFKDNVTKEIQAKYLLMCHELIGPGLVKLSKLLEEEYVKILKPIPLKRLLTLNELEKIFWTIQVAVKENSMNPVTNFRPYMIPNDVVNEENLYNLMMQETMDVFDSEEVKSIISSCISHGFVTLGDRISEYYVLFEESSQEKSSNEEEFVHPVNSRIAFAKLIPILNGLFLNNSFPNQLVQQHIISDRIKILGANIYETFSA